MIIFLVCIAFILLVTSVGVVVTIFYFKIKKRQQLIRYERVEHFPINNNISTFSQFSILQGKVTNNWILLNMYWFSEAVQNQEQFHFNENVMYQKPNENEQEGTAKKVQLVGEQITTVVSLMQFFTLSALQRNYIFFRRRCD